MIMSYDYVRLPMYVYCCPVVTHDYALLLLLLGCDLDRVIPLLR